MLTKDLGMLPLQFAGLKANCPTASVPAPGSPDFIGPVAAPGIETPGAIPPGWTPDWQYEISSRSSSGQPGGKSWWDPNGGEWHYHDTDPWHPDPHWDFNPWSEWNSPWQNVDFYGNVIPRK